MLSEPPAQDQRLHPLEWYRHMRDSAPVSQDPQGGAWQVFRYDDVKRVLSDYATFSSASIARTGAIGDPASPLEASLISTDPPRHRQLRALVSQAFTPKAVADLEPRIAAITNDLLDRVAASGRMDVVDDLAYPLPVIVIVELLGIPTGDRARFKEWSDAIVSGASSAAMAGRDPQAEMSAYFLRLVAERRRDPRADLISALLAAQVDGQHLTELELLGFCVLLLVAGNETTTNLIANAIRCFDDNPEALRQLYARPELLPNAIEEVLRYSSPVRCMFRTTAAEARLGAHTIGAGQYVVAWIASANHDPEQFADPDRFDIARSPNRHIAFGQGVHFCLGAPLARLEARIALTAMLARLRDIARDRATPLVPLTGTVVAGVRHLPITFTPETRILGVIQ